MTLDISQPFMPINSCLNILPECQEIPEPNNLYDSSSLGRNSREVVHSIYTTTGLEGSSVRKTPDFATGIIKKVPYSNLHPKKKLRIDYNNETDIIGNNVHNYMTNNEEQATSKLAQTKIIPLDFVPHQSKYTDKQYLPISQKDSMKFSNDIQISQNQNLNSGKVNAPCNFTSSSSLNFSHKFTSESSSYQYSSPYYESITDNYKCSRNILNQFCEPTLRDNSDKPQDLRVSYSERLKDVARDLLNAEYIPNLNYQEIPKAVEQRSHTNPIRGKINNLIILVVQ